jgi:3-dehydroquinate synthase
VSSLRAGAGDIPRANVTTIRVDTAAPYDVVVGHGLFGRLPDLVGPRAERVAIVHPPALRPAAERIRLELVGQGYQAGMVAVPDAEQQKTADVAAACWTELARLGLTRSDVVLGVGGGATTDLAGFVAATWLRGVRVVQVPTTLLGMVDAAVGGKTGINTDAGKNLVGVFHEPAGVLCDLDTLATLPRDDVVAGLAEVVKCGFVADQDILDLVEQRPADAVDVSSPVLRELVERAVRVKAAVVAGDLRETDAASGSGLGREVLNYGHTFGHAIEQVERYTWRHGAAVAVGMVFVAELARLAGLLDPATAERHRTVLRLVGLPTAYRGGAWPALLDAMRRDKKARGDGLRFVVLEGIARPAALVAPDLSLLAAAYAHVSAE